MTYFFGDLYFHCSFFSEPSQRLIVLVYVVLFNPSGSEGRHQSDLEPWVSLSGRTVVDFPTGAAMCFRILYEGEL